MPIDAAHAEPAGETAGSSILAIVPEALYDVLARVLPGCGLVYGLAFLAIPTLDSRPAVHFLIDHMWFSLAFGYVAGLLMPPIIRIFLPGSVSGAKKACKAAWSDWNLDLQKVRAANPKEGQRLFKLLSEADCCCGLFNASLVIAGTALVLKARGSLEFLSPCQYWGVLAIVVAYLYIQSWLRVQRFRNGVILAAAALPAYRPAS